jgi:hypothetical protein
MNDLIHADRNPDGSLRITVAPAMANHVAHMIVMLASQLQNGHAVPPADGAVMSAPVRLRYGGRMKISKRELAETLGISTRTIDHWRAERIIPYRKIRGVILFDPAEVEQALERFRVYAYWEPKRRMGRNVPP